MISQFGALDLNAESVRLLLPVLAHGTVSQSNI